MKRPKYTPVPHPGSVTLNLSLTKTCPHLLQLKTSLSPSTDQPANTMELSPGMYTGKSEYHRPSREEPPPSREEPPPL